MQIGVGEIAQQLQVHTAITTHLGSVPRIMTISTGKHETY